MELPEIIATLIKAQNRHDSTAYAECFSDTAAVKDEGSIHTGKVAIQQWNEKTSREYKTMLEPVAFEGTGEEGILTAKVSGTFDSSPLTLNFHFKIADGLIQALEVTG